MRKTPDLGATLDALREAAEAIKAQRKEPANGASPRLMVVPLRMPVPRDKVRRGDLTNLRRQGEIADAEHDLANKHARNYQVAGQLVEAKDALAQRQAYLHDTFDRRVDLQREEL